MSRDLKGPVKITAEQLELITEHAIRDAPNECCGFVAVKGDVATRVLVAENEAHSPLRFEISGKQLFQLIDEIESAGEELGAIYHSHTRSAPYPSQTDINFAAGWPGIEWLIVGVKDGLTEVKSYLITDGVVSDVPVAIAG
ncbi:MAG: M67 family metallopeptidase [Solirubrobacteraceae bacterium]|nr:M67 family metallopeptidase [Solirubrobacteraceae bacterium]